MDTLIYELRAKTRYRAKCFRDRSISVKNATVLTGWRPLWPRSMSAAGAVSDRANSPDSRASLHSSYGGQNGPPLLLTPRGATRRLGLAMTKVISEFAIFLVLNRNRCYNPRHWKLGQRRSAARPASRRE